MSHADVLFAGLSPSCWADSGMTAVCFGSVVSLLTILAISGMAVLGALAYILRTRRRWVLLVLLTFIHTIVQMPGMLLAISRPEDQQLGARVAGGLLAGIFFYYLIGAHIMGTAKAKPKPKKPRNVGHLSFWQLLLRYNRALIPRRR